LQSQGDAKKFYGSVGDALASTGGDASAIKQNTVLQTDNVRMIAVAVPVSGVWSAPDDGRDRLVVLFDQINNTAKPKEKNTSFPQGMLAWFGNDTQTAPLTNQLDHPMRLMVLEFQDAAREKPAEHPGSSSLDGEYCLSSTSDNFRNARGQ